MSLVCNCSLAGTRACKECRRFREYYGELNPESHGEREVVIEEFDKDGRLVKRTIEKY